MSPLKGYRVLDLTNVLAGPFCGHQLVHLGAEVIKVEVPGSGDLARQLGADPELNENNMGVSFLAQNAGKRSITLNLKNPDGIEVLRKLVESADVLLENFRPGVMDRLGLGYDDLKKHNPHLVYCAISGFGQDGPLKNLPAYDHIIQGMAGVMSITGDADTAPYRIGYPASDTIGGMTAAFAITSALASKDKENIGCFIDVSMLEATLATMGWVVSNFLIAGVEPKPMGNQNFTASPSGTFKTGDGLINIAANKQAHFEGVCEAIGKPELIDDARFVKRQARLENRIELNAIIEKALASDSAMYWEENLSSRNVPVGRVATVREALEMPQVRDRDMVAEFDNVPGVNKSVRVARTGIKLNGSAPAVAQPPPELGQHTDEILEELGYEHGEIARLRENEAV